MVIENRNRLAEARAGREAPLLGRLDRFLIEAEDRVERPDDLNVADRAVRPHDALEQDRALDLRAHRVRGVLRLHFAQDARQRARRCPAGRRRRPCRRRSRAETRIPSGTDAAAGAGARAAAGARSLRQASAVRRRLDRAGQRVCAPRPALRRNVQLLDRSAARSWPAAARASAASSTGTVILSLPGQLGLTRRLLHLVAAAATATAGPGWLSQTILSLMSSGSTARSDGNRGTHSG